MEPVHEWVTTLTVQVHVRKLTIIIEHTASTDDSPEPEQGKKDQEALRMPRKSSEAGRSPVAKRSKIKDSLERLKREGTKQGTVRQHNEAHLRQGPMA